MSSLLLSSYIFSCFSLVAEHRLKAMFIFPNNLMQWILSL